MKEERSLVRIVELMVREMGEATAEDLWERLKGGKYSERQVRRAIQNARAQGFIVLKGHRVIPGTRGRMSVYGATAERAPVVDFQAGVERVVLAKRQVTVSEIAEHFPAKERYLVGRALDKLRDQGKVEQVRKIFVGDSDRDNCWYVPPGHTVRFNSVFDYGTRA